MSEIKRFNFLSKIDQAFEVNPVCALLGSRQCGKTTLAKAYAKIMNVPVYRFDLENPADLKLLESPMLALEGLEGLIIIDEIQRRPEFFPILRILVDQHKNRQFLILGSASQDLIQQSSETLAGRISYIEMTPFQLTEGEIDLLGLWGRGGFPKSYLANNEEKSVKWRKDFIQTFLEKDVPNLGFQSSPQMIRRFWSMLAHYHGQIFNASEIGTSLNVSYKTAQQYLDILEGTFMVRRLNPWYENLMKRQVKSPKIYLRDTGILHTFLGIQNHEELQRHPKLGASWEGFALEEIIRVEDVDAIDCYFWATQAKAELDLLILKNAKKIGFEFKYTDVPKLTPSMRIAMEDLKLDQLNVIVPYYDEAKPPYQIADKTFVWGLKFYLKVAQTKIETEYGVFYLEDVRWEPEKWMRDPTKYGFLCIYENLSNRRRIGAILSAQTVSDYFYDNYLEKEAVNVIKRVLTKEYIFKDILKAQLNNEAFLKEFKKQADTFFTITPEMFEEKDFKKQPLYQI